MSIAFAHADAGLGARMVQPTATAVAAGVEPEDMDAGLLVRIVVGVALIIVVIVIVVFQVMNLGVQTVESQMADGVGRKTLTEIELSAARKLTRYAVVDAETATYQIPIERAMELMAGETYQQPKEDYTEEVRLLPR